MDIFAAADYKHFVKDWVTSQPKGGHGQYRRIAEYLGVGTVLVSQIFNGDRDLSSEQAYKLAKYLQLTPLETNYFILLVQIARAGTADFRKHVEEQAESVRKQARDLRNRMPQRAELSEEAKAVFYSRWIYSAIRLLSSVPGFQTVDAIAKHLELPRPIVAEAVEFLLANGLCILENDQIKMGPSWTHLAKDSPFVIPRQTGWRLKAIEEMEQHESDSLYFTSPVVLSSADFEVIRNQLLEVISKFRATVEPSPSETLACLNIDWFKL